jgi:hypothetical protein
MCEFYRALMTHASVPPDERVVLGISDTLVSYDYLLDMYSIYTC